MHSHLRLAERQGLLTGRHLSEVQVQALQILTYLDDVDAFRDSQKDKLTKFKLGLLTRDDYVPEKLFPEFWPDRVVDNEDDVPDGDSVDYDYSNVEWQGPSEADQDELNRMLALLQKATGQVTGAVAMNNSAGEMGKWV